MTTSLQLARSGPSTISLAQLSTSTPPPQSPNHTVPYAGSSPALANSYQFDGSSSSEKFRNSKYEGFVIVDFNVTTFMGE